MQYSQYGQPIFQQREPGQRVDFAWLSESFDLFKQQMGTWIVSTLIAVFGVGAIYMVITFAVEISMMGPMMKAGAKPAQIMAMYQQMMGLIILFSLPLFVLLGYFISGFLRMAIRQVRGEYIEIADLFRGWPATPRLLGLYFMHILISYVLLAPAYWKYFTIFAHGIPSGSAADWVFLGVTYVVGFLAIAVMGCFVGPAYILVADGEKVFRAISRSATAMRHDWLRAFGLSFIYGLIYTASAIPCALGLFVTLPMGALMLALLYRDMLGMPAPIPVQYNYAPQAEGSWPPPPSL